MLAADLVPLKVTDIAIGKPLPWPVYGPNKRLLLREGFVIETQRQLETLIKSGLYRNPTWHRSELRSGNHPAVEQIEPEEAGTAHYSFEEMKPRVGDAVQLQVRTDFSDERYPVKLIGFVKGRTVMVSTPAQDGAAILMREGQPVVVRSFSGKDAYGFSSSVLRVCNTPLPYLHLAYPKSVQSVAVRKTERARFHLIGSVVNVGNQDSSSSRPALISDISVTGASFTVSAAVAEKGERLDLSFRVKINETDMYPTITCVVRSISNENDIGSETEKYRYGVQFESVSQDVFLILQNMIFQKLLENH